jgi:hypothetical protein
MGRVVELAAAPQQYSKTEITTLDDEANALSIRLFRISSCDTYIELVDVDDDDPTALADEQIKRIEQYEALLPICDKMYDEARHVWESLGWDISDGKGDELRGAHLFLRQILAVEAGVIEGAEFCPNGDGKPLYTDESSLEGRLLAEAEAFMVGKS